VHLAVDLTILDREGMEASGLGRYALEIAEALSAVRPDWRLTLYTRRPELLSPYLRQSVKAPRLSTASTPGRVAWLNAGSFLDGRADRPDAWFGPSFVLPPWWRGASVVTIHDVLVFALPERYRGRLNARYAATAIRHAAHRADRVLCGSSATKGELEARLGIAGGKIEVMPYGVSQAFFEGGQAVPAGDPPYLLFVGTFEPRKGIEVLWRALGDLERQGRRVRLVLAGQAGWGTEALVNHLRADPRVEIIIRPSDDRLAELYRGALALVYPSRMEGFGLPVAEAMASRCPVIASDLACIREFAQQAPLYARVGSHGDIVSHVTALLDDPIDAERRRASGAELAVTLRWATVGERTARSIEDAFRLRRAHLP